MSSENLPKSAPCSTIVSAISKYSIFSAFHNGGFDFESRDSLSAPRTHKISTTLPRLFLTANEIGDSFDADARFGSAFYRLNLLNQYRGCHIRLYHLGFDWHTLECNIWFWVRPRWNVTLGLGLNHIRRQHFTCQIIWKCCSLISFNPRPNVTL